ncbi:hypothetical protein JL722_14734 [Aureococcus anophagefferens]|nr:hypothetical protein JL722_14734 [Aureococcus anophagefferens]
MAPSPSPMFDLPAMLINLDRAPDRLAFMEKQFAEHGVRYERFPAVDGAAVAGDPAVVVEGCAVEYCAPADFGIERERCESEANEHEAVVVVEDDISLEFVPKWTRSLGDIARADGWGIVKISCNHPAGVRNLLKMDEGLVPFKRHYWSTGMYIINRRGMKLVLDKYCAGAAFRAIYDVDDCFMYTVPLVCEATFESTVHDADQEHTDYSSSPAAKVVRDFYKAKDLSATVSAMLKAMPEDQLAAREKFLAAQLNSDKRKAAAPPPPPTAAPAPAPPPAEPDEDPKAKVEDAARGLAGQVVGAEEGAELLRRLRRGEARGRGRRANPA